MKKSGIYKIINTINKKLYVGSANDIRTRWVIHRYQLNHQKHGNILLQRSWNKYGKKNFKFEILEICTKEQLIEKEQYYLDFYKSYERNIGYNINKVAGSNQGRKFGPHTKEHNRKISLALQGSKRDGTYLLGNTYAKGQTPWNKGKKLSKSICVKFRQAKLRHPVRYWKNKHRPLETNKKISNTLKGRKLSKQHAINIGKGHLGLKRSEKTKRLMRIARKRYYRKLKSLNLKHLG